MSKVVEPRHAVAGWTREHWRKDREERENLKPSTTCAEKVKTASAVLDGHPDQVQTFADTFCSDGVSVLTSSSLRRNPSGFSFPSHLSLNLFLFLPGGCYAPAKMAKITERAIMLSAFARTSSRLLRRRQRRRRDRREEGNSGKARFLLDLLPFRLRNRSHAHGRRSPPARHPNLCARRAAQCKKCGEGGQAGAGVASARVAGGRSRRQVCEILWRSSSERGDASD